MSFSARFFKMHKRTLLALLFGLAFSATLAYAVPPTSPYLPSDQQLDPGCAPTDINCTVDISSVIRYVGTSYVGKTSGAGADGTNGGTAHNIFIGDGAGADGTTVSNAIALGAYANTGGFSNSIIVGSGTSGSPIANTKANQFMLAPTITEARLRGVDYSLPASQAGGAGYVLINNGSGTLSWGAQSGAGGAIALLTNGVANGSQSALDLVAGTGISLTDNGTGSVTIAGSAAPDTIYTADGTVSGARQVSYSDTIYFVDTATTYKTGLSLIPSTLVSLLGDISQNSTYLSVDNNSNIVTIGNGSLYIPAGASNGYVLTSDGSGIASWQAPSGGGSSAWGGITGTLSDQTDLQGALDAKFDIPSGTIAQYIRGDGSLATFTTSGLALETNATPNGSQSLLNLISGSNITLTDNGTGGVTIAATGTVSPITIQNTSSLFSTGFAGTGSGSTATNAIFLGVDAGNGATSATDSNFFGNGAGFNATDAVASNFFGTQAGAAATNALASNFFGNFTGRSATNASNSNFLGTQAGYNATNASNSNFFGLNAGNGATGATGSNFFGNSAGDGALNAANSFFAGASAGARTVNPIIKGSTNSANAIFIGANAGYFAADAALDNTGNANDYSILLGQNTSTGGFKNSIAIGSSATNTAANQFVVGSTTRPITSVRIGGGQGTGSASTTVFIGNSAGGNATNASLSNFIGAGAGNNATDATFSNFFGYGAGSGADRAFNANFIGAQAGDSADDANSSNFIGAQAGFSATNANDAVFIGTNAGYFGTNTNNSIFLGKLTGSKATNAAKSTFIGYRAGGYSGVGVGFGALNAANSIFLGSNAGFQDTVDNTTNADDFSILLGNNTSTGGFSNSIALGANATNTATNQFMIGSTTRPIDITRINGSASTQCTITTGTGIACTSDERLKTDITDLPTSILDTLLNVKTVTYHWLQNPDTPQQIGFLAQDLEQYFPQLVATDSDGYKSVYYAQMTPILVEAIREMNLKIIDINDLTKDNSWRSALVAWLGSASNGIGSFFSKEVHTDTLCVKKSDGSELCLTGDQLQNALNNQGTTIVVPTPPTPAPTVEPDPTVLEITPEETTPEPISDPVPETPITDPVASPETPTPAQ